ncbi:MAG: putative heme-binding domain-containing protein [Verrucomicrobiales bacterium]|jgi:putative heme-binding domain-containing protein
MTSAYSVKSRQLLIAAGVFLYPAAAALAQQKLQDIPPPDPEVERASFQLADGFEINLWAADPLLAKPTQINFDREGRLWVSSSQTYPQLNVNQDPNDRIIILEDTNNDRRADKSSIYYDELIIPGGVLPDGVGGTYVAHAEELIHLSDTDGDGKADRKEVLLSGFGTEDTHHTLHRLRWGPDGLLYMLQGYYIGTHVETLYGSRRLNGGGLWSYDTRSRRLEIYSRGLINPWGMIFDRWGQTFQTDGAGGDGINYTFPDSVFVASPHENRILRGLNPGSPKLCGIERISGGHFPEEWRGSLLANDFRANNIDRYTIEEQNSGYVSTLQDDLLSSSHVSFRPIDLVMGPDGAIYIADWYSPIIQHGEVDFRDQRRDQVHGRIWRITAKGRPLIKPVDYKGATIAGLLDLLKADEDWVRLNAKQELKERDENEVEAALSALLQRLDRDDADDEHQRLEALWAYQTIATKPNLGPVQNATKSSDPRIRAAAVRLFYHWHTDPKDLAQFVNDPHPRVRREAVTALGQYGSAEAAAIAMQALDHPIDTYIDFALWRTCRLLEPHWLPAFQKGEQNFDGNAGKLAFALKAIEKPEALAPLVALLKRGGDGADPSTVRLVGKIGTAQDLDVLIPIAASQDHPLTPHAGLALREAAEDRGVAPADGSELEAACRNLLASNEPKSVAAGCRLAGLWKLSVLRPDLEARLTSDQGAAASYEIRQAAAHSLADLGGREVLMKLAANLPAEAKTAAIVALVRIAPTEGGGSAASLLTQPLPDSMIDALMSAVLVNSESRAALAAGLESRSIPNASAIQAARLVETSGTNALELSAALAKAGGIKLVPQKLTAEQLAALLSKLDQADPERGQLIYERAQLACAACHKVGGKGGVIGPDLSSIGASAPIDYLIESLIEPSKKIKEGYRMSLVTAKNGDVFAGAIVREDQNVVVIRNAAGSESRLPKSTIESRETSPVSLMPSGLTTSLREDEFIDLIAYLASLGKQQ